MKIEKGKEYTFHSKYGDLERYNGTMVRIISSFAEIPNEPNLYRAVFVDGRYYDVFEYELSN